MHGLMERFDVAVENGETPAVAARDSKAPALAARDVGSDSGNGEAPAIAARDDVGDFGAVA